MSRFESRTLAMAALTLLGCTAAVAADNGFYLGGALGQSKADVRIGSFNFDDSHAGYKMFAGLRPIDRLGAEAEYIDFGSSQTASTTVDHDAFAAFLVGYVPLPLVDLYGKVGVSRWSSDIRFSLGSGDDSGTDLAYGLGLQLRFASFSARLEYEKFDVSGGDHLSLLSLGAAWTFL